MPRPTPNEISRSAALVFGVNHKDIMEKSRLRCDVRARWAAIAIIREKTRHSLPTIGRYFNGMDHTTVMHGITKVNAIAATDPAMAQNLTAVREMSEKMAEVRESTDRELISMLHNGVVVHPTFLMAHSEALSQPFIPPTVIRRPMSELPPSALLQPTAAQLYSGRASSRRVREITPNNAG